MRVCNAGNCIPPEQLPRLFDRFFRADPARSRDRGGSGLGLSIAASVTEALGGTLHHEATPGGGLTMVVSLPTDPGWPLVAPVASDVAMEAAR